MAFDAAAYTSSSLASALPVLTLIDTAGDPCPEWAAENPDHALALLFVTPRACAAVDVLVSL
ncbi:MAG: hypothetical protein PSV23_08740 [Brevundimonas sp.]|uniref:hypothetical protein n=1 Tax=Brevundimonas sp. TaxID=1871086 RepID=UPI0024896E65|nr:hypothetical protein [Brevundimonas sp.]MDI1326867.1 hypothetical protein [Brevundimonas sp.]